MKVRLFSLMDQLICAWFLISHSTHLTVTIILSMTSLVTFSRLSLIQEYKPGDTTELGLIPVGVEEETHGTSQVSRSIACRVVQRSGGEQSLGGIASVKKGVGDNCDFQDNQDNNTYDD